MKDVIEFLEEPHIYLKNGVIVESVTTLLKKYKFKDKYNDVPSNILKAKAEFGSGVHKAIELLETTIEDVFKNLTLYQKKCVLEYERLKKEYKWKVLSQEQIVSYEYLYIGTYDMIFSINGEECLVDIKTTAVLDKEYLKWQLGLYNYAMKTKYKKFYCIWLPKGKNGELVEIEIPTKEEIEEFLEEVRKGEIK